MIELLAQATPAQLDQSFVGSMVGAAGGVGFAIFFGVYTTMYLIPRMLADFRAELAETRRHNGEQMALFRVELKEEREARSRDSLRIVEAINNRAAHH